MKATLQFDGSLKLSAAGETRFIAPDHPSFRDLMELYQSAASAELEARAAAPPPGEYVPPAGFGGWPWKMGVPEAGKVYQIPLEDLHADPARLQFRADADNPLADQKFDPNLCSNPLIVWKGGGLTFVVDGHRRHQVAKWYPTETPTLPCIYTDAKSADHARAVGALVNIARGTATAQDAATFLYSAGRTVEDLAAANINLDRRTAAEITARKHQMERDALAQRASQQKEKSNHAARRRQAAIEAAIREREGQDDRRRSVAANLPRGSEADRSGASNDPAQRRVGPDRLLTLDDLPEGYSIRAAGNRLGLYREGRGTPLATAASADELVRRIAGAGRVQKPAFSLQLSAAYTSGPIHMRLACGDEKGIEIMHNSEVAMFLPIVAGGNPNRVHRAAIKLVESFRQKATTPVARSRPVSLSACDVMASVAPSDVSAEVKIEALKSLRKMFPHDAA